MGDFDGDDFDIDELLDEIDSTGTKGKDPKSTPAADKTNPTISGSGGAAAGNKSVRFSDDGTGSGETAATAAVGSGDDDFISKLPRSQREPPSSSLRTMFFADNKPSSAPTPSSTKPPLPPSASSRGRSSTASGGASDWLGIQDGKGGSRGGSPTNSPPPTRPRSTAKSSGSVRGSSTERSKVPGTSSDEEEALFKDIGLPRQSRRSQSQPVPSSAESNPHPSASRSRSGTGEHNPFPSSQDTQPKPLSTLPSKSTFSSSYLDQLGMSPPLPNESPKTSLDLSKPSFGPSSTITKQSPIHHSLPSSAALLGTGNPNNVIIPPAQESSSGFALAKPEPLSSFSLMGPSVPQSLPSPQGSQQQGTGTGTTKKKVVKKDASGTGVTSTVSSTLQLPIHLINEEELKAMSSSLKTLYSNQLDMLEKSYKEQMDFLNDANRRKEELLREEMKAMQSDYEERLERHRHEIRELEASRQPQLKSFQDLEGLQNLSEKLSVAVKDLQDLFGKSGSTTDALNVQIQSCIQNSIQENLKKDQENKERLEDKMSETVKSLDESVAKRFGMMNDAWRNLLGQIKNNMTELLETAQMKGSRSDAELEKELVKLEANIARTIEGMAKGVDEKGDKTSEKVIGKLSESEKNLLGELGKILRLLRKTKEQTEGITLEPIVKVLETDRDDEQRRRERLASSIKEMRREIKRLSMENESRQESMQKFNMTAELELKSISQSIRDLNSQMKFSLISGPENMTNQFNSSMQQTQAEMEMKLLREERHALSDSMAQVNVEKRKLSEDRIELEKQKLDFQRERDKIKNLEIQLQTKIEETEEMQKKAESVRKEELYLSSEAQQKLKELSKEKAALREKLHEAEQRLRAWEQKLRQDRVELAREREFMDKLREQMLCPGCMKQHNRIVVPPPPPYIPNETILTSTSNQGLAAENYFNSRISAINGGTGGSGDPNDLFDTYYHKLFD